jgi:23S rRNA (cytidine1920-2'-O)/16S rRNA (cytidine1409-2'-O)-methyltransferase
MAKKVLKHRLDEELVTRGLVLSKEKAAAVIMAGDVSVDGQVVYKADAPVTADNRIELKEKFPYASRGALKIEAAFKAFNIDIKGLNALDIGISTGGFSDYMLKHGAKQVTGVDVNTRQVDYQLRQDSRLKLIETNARDVSPDQIDFQPDIITIDVSFISITKILPALSAFPRARIVALVKPQFEARRDQVGRGGVIRKKQTHIDVVLDLKQRIADLNYGVTGFTSSGVKGRKGNREYFFLLEYGKKPSVNDKIVTHAIKTEL